METNLELASRVAEHGDVTKQLIIVMIGVAAVVAALSAALHLEATEEQRRSDGLVEKGLATEQWQFALNQTRAELIASTDDVILRAGDSIGAVAHSTNEVGRILFVARVRALADLRPLLVGIQTIASTNLPDDVQRYLAGTQSRQATLQSIGLNREASIQAAMRGRRSALALFIVAIATALLALMGVAPRTRATRPAFWVAGLGILSAAILAGTSLV